MLRSLKRIEKVGVKPHFKSIFLSFGLSGPHFQVEIEEFLKGCLRFRGQAKAIDIGQLLHDQVLLTSFSRCYVKCFQEWLITNQGRFQTYVEAQHSVSRLSKAFEGIKEVMFMPFWRPKWAS